MQPGLQRDRVNTWISLAAFLFAYLSRDLTPLAKCYSSLSALLSANHQVSANIGSQSIVQSLSLLFSSKTAAAHIQPGSSFVGHADGTEIAVARARARIPSGGAGRLRSRSRRCHQVPAARQSASRLAGLCRVPPLLAACARRRGHAAVGALDYGRPGGGVAGGFVRLWEWAGGAGWRVRPSVPC